MNNLKKPQNFYFRVKTKNSPFIPSLSLLNPSPNISKPRPSKPFEKIQVQLSPEQINMERNKKPAKPSSNSFINLGWQETPPAAPAPVPPSQAANFQSRLDQILQNEAKRKILTKKDVKTSVKVSKPPGGSNNFSFG